MEMFNKKSEKEKTVTIENKWTRSKGARITHVYCVYWVRNLSGRQPSSSSTVSISRFRVVAFKSQGRRRIDERQLDHQVRWVSTNQSTNSSWVPILKSLFDVAIFDYYDDHTVQLWLTMNRKLAKKRRQRPRDALVQVSVIKSTIKSLSNKERKASQRQTLRIINTLFKRRAACKEKEEKG